MTNSKDCHQVGKINSKDERVQPKMKTKDEHGAEDETSMMNLKMKRHDCHQVQKAE